MFLSKKNAIYFNKPKNIDPDKPRRRLAGWEDDDQEKKTYEYASNKYESSIPKVNLVTNDLFANVIPDTPPPKEVNHRFYLNWDELNDKNDIQCEKRVVEDIVQPGGIRIKPNQTMLNQLLKEVKGMEVHIIGSLLLSKLEVNYPFQTKAKALYTIDFLAKKNDVYQSYFKANVDKIRDFPEPEDNVQNYRKILKSVLNGLGLSTSNQNIPSTEQPKPTFVDPGYNDDPKALMSNFLQSNSSKTKKAENKKVIIGPGQKKGPAVAKKEQNPNDLLGMDLLGSSQPQPTNAQNNLMEQGGLISFDDMMGGNVPTTQKQSNPPPAANTNFLL